MNKVIAVILLLAFFGQTFNQGFYYLSYLIDKKEYAQKCINKTKPKMQCSGKCQLMKKIKELERKQQQQAPEMKLVGKIEVLSSRSFYAGFNFCAESTVKQKYYIGAIGSPIDQPCSFFHPPDRSFLV